MNDLTNRLINEDTIKDYRESYKTAIGAMTRFEDITIVPKGNGYVISAGNNVPILDFIFENPSGKDYSEKATDIIINQKAADLIKHTVASAANLNIGQLTQKLAKVLDVRVRNIPKYPGNAKGAYKFEIRGSNESSAHVALTVTVLTTSSADFTSYKTLPDLNTGVMFIPDDLDDTFDKDAAKNESLSESDTIPRQKHMKIIYFLLSLTITIILLLINFFS